MEESKERETAPKVSRRRFLVGSGAAIGAVLTGWKLKQLRAESAPEPAPEGERPETVLSLLRDLDDKVQEIYQIRGTWRKEIEIQERDTLESIAREAESTPEAVNELNHRWGNTSPKISPGLKIFVPETLYPTKATKKIFDRLAFEKEQLEATMDFYGPDSQQAKEMAGMIWGYWQTEPGEKKKLPKPRITIHPESARQYRGEWVKKEVRDFLAAIPNSERIVGLVKIRPYQKEWPKPAGAIPKKESPGTILFSEPVSPKNRNYGYDFVEWNRKHLQEIAMHEFTHCISPYGAGYVFNFLTPREVVEFVHELTLLSDKDYRPSGTDEAIQKNEGDELNAMQVQYLFRGKERRRSAVPLIYEFEDFYNRYFSRILDCDFDIKALSRQLGVT